MATSRFSILTGLLLIGVLGVAFAAIRAATPTWAGAIGSITFFLLLAALLGVGYARGTARAFWVGFAALGWGYMVLSSVPWFSQKTLSLLAIPLSDDIFGAVHPDGNHNSGFNPFGGGIRGNPGSFGDGMGGGMGGGFRNMMGGGGGGGMPAPPATNADTWSSRTIGRNLEALFWAILGGWVARSFRAGREGPAAPAPAG